MRVPAPGPWITMSPSGVRGMSVSNRTSESVRASTDETSSWGVSALSEIRAAGAALVAVSPQRPDRSLTFAEQKALEFPVLSDAGNAVARQYGLVFTQGEAAMATSRELGI